MGTEKKNHENEYRIADTPLYLEVTLDGVEYLHVGWTFENPSRAILYRKSDYKKFLYCESTGEFEECPTQ